LSTLRHCLLLFCCLWAASPAVLADAESVQRQLRARLPGMTIEGVQRSPFAGLYEAVVDGEILYTDEKAEYLFSGDVFDIRTLPPRNLTQANAQRSVLGVLARAATEIAIKRVRGNGKRVLYTFEDPNCSYCKALQPELAKLTDVTIYTFPTPLLSVDSADKSLAAWCAPDRAAAWETIMSGGKLPGEVSKERCVNPLDKVAALAKRLEVNSTPVLFLGSGQRINGFVTGDKLEKALSAAR
jgi:thiol:disulfide interchange protein DsbC